MYSKREVRKDPTANVPSEQSAGEGGSSPHGQLQKGHSGTEGTADGKARGEGMSGVWEQQGSQCDWREGETMRAELVEALSRALTSTLSEAGTLGGRWQLRTCSPDLQAQGPVLTRGPGRGALEAIIMGTRRPRRPWGLLPAGGQAQWGCPHSLLPWQRTSSRVRAHPHRPCRAFPRPCGLGTSSLPSFPLSSLRTSSALV